MGGCWHLSERPGYKWGVSPQQQHSFPFSSWKHNLSFDFTDPLHRPTSDRMQAPNRPVGLYGYSVRNYAPATMYSQYPASQCANSTKSPPGKSFTIDALLAKTEDTSSCRSSLTQCADKCYPAAPFVPLTGHLAITAAAPTAPYLCSPTMLHSASHMQSGYSLYCCPPFSYQPPCRGALYAQGKTTIQSCTTDPWDKCCLRRTKYVTLRVFAASMSKVNTGMHSFKTKAGKSKRIRTSFTSEQLSRLEKEFARQQYMVGSERFLLASALQLTEAQVRKRPPETKSQMQQLRNTRPCAWCCVVNAGILCSGQSLVPEQTHQVAQTESGAAAGQTGQTGPGCPTQKSRVSRPRRRGVLWLGRGYWRVGWLHGPLLTRQHWAFKDFCRYQPCL